MVYIGLVALVQKDMKKLVAYSSVAHMGFVTLGFFIFNELGVAGGIVQMISHGFVSGAMFLCIGVLYDRVHSREIAAYGGVVNTMPKFAALRGVLRDGQLRPAGHRGFRRRVDGDPRHREGQLLARRAGRDDAGASAPPTRCGWSSASTSAPVANDDVKALTDINAPRVPDAGAAGRRGAVDGRVSRSRSPT